MKQALADDVFHTMQVSHCRARRQKTRDKDCSRETNRENECSKERDGPFVFSNISPQTALSVSHPPAPPHLAALRPDVDKCSLTSLI